MGNGGRDRKSQGRKGTIELAVCSLSRLVRTAWADNDLLVSIAWDVHGTRFSCVHVITQRRSGWQAGPWRASQGHSWAAHKY